MANKFDSYMIETIDHSAKSDPASASESVDWLKKSAKTLLENKGNLKMPEGLGKSQLVSKMDKSSIGKMFMYVYDPKHKDTLPYYDTLPLIFVVAFTNDGFYGLNLHYVPPFVRNQIIEALGKNLNRSGISESRKVKMSYEILKRSSKFAILKHCFKRYLASHVLSSYMFIDPSEWNKTVMLPTEKFKKQTKANIYRAFIGRNLAGK